MLREKLDYKRKVEEIMELNQSTGNNNQERWDNIVTTLTKAAENALGFKTGKKKYISEDSSALSLQ